eukprot:11923492-Alexandrium_andersonii.AAC.1
MTKFVYNAGTWGKLSQAEARRYHSGVMGFLRLVLSKQDRQSMKDQEVVDALHVWAPYGYLFAARMRFMRRFRLAPDVTHNLVLWAAGDEYSWLSAITQDLVHMWTEVESVSCMPDPRVSFRE